MDPHRFDTLARSLATPKTRRGFLGGLAALGAGLFGASAGGAQVSQAHCGNVICRTNPGKCKAGCVCCVFSNGNSRCMPPASCSGVITSPTTTTTTTQAPTPTTTTAAPPTTTAAPTTSTTTATPTTTTTTTTVTPTTTTTAPPMVCPTGQVPIDGVCRTPCGTLTNFCPDDGFCCRSALCCTANQICITTSPAAQCMDVCHDGRGQCGDVCCPTGSSCSNGICRNCGIAHCNLETQICCAGDVCCNSSTESCGTATGTCSRRP